ncbi:MAG: hypothetical protein A2651_01190 [Candidatus Yanofskybacteria bacterium RIFCSPHIGHO2_01_FULL_42_12]|uniref:Uncharacterized protein n=1 Tax=Candidatus Yanofskybacteria bacterium RIFCSPLOWO2_01_FULL_42_49 TaxID=1802694 RepID=A0A1F8GC73_9BACT|nr:MAG: hypothetical protein A2651_01190 [Candidatus Yanofskybacteria bacterium RIFCSPHIGHO2_01_FULL_42_12]OGN22640.1 MAG: hypothetical protein A2918_00860 [Candidatus Yanofskybacteria bacterium RIFCSPLOWO2_01_FULL_42_49]
MPESRFRLEGTKTWIGVEIGLRSDTEMFGVGEGIIFGVGVTAGFDIEPLGADMTAGAGVKIGDDTLTLASDISWSTIFLMGINERAV